MKTNAPTYDVKAFLGIRNTGRSQRLPVGSLASAQNVDIDDEGMITMRRGFVSSKALTSVTAAYSPIHEDFSYVVANGVLYRIDDSLNAYALGNVSTAETHWTEAGNMVFMSTGYIVEGDKLIPWAVQPPDDLLVRIGAGSLTAGRYMVTATQDAADGRESPTCSVVVLELTDNQGIHIDNSAGKNIYITEADGEILYFVGDGIEHLGNSEQLAVPLNPALLNNETVPDGIETIAYYDTAIYASRYYPSDNQTIVYYSKPYLFHVFDIFQDYFILPGEVRVMVAAGGNLIIGTDREIYAYDGQNAQKVASYGVPRGHQAATGKNGYTLLYTNRGPCDCNPFKNLTQDKCSLAPGNSVSVAVVEQDGMEKFIVLTDGGGTANNLV